jgi:MFS family permease
MSTSEATRPGPTATAASTICTDPNEYGLSNTQYGLMFLPQVATAITASPLGARAGRRFGTMVTVGRVLFAAIDRRLSVRTTYRLLPFLLAATFAVIALLPDGSTAAGIVAFGVAGLGCSALLPLTIGFGTKELARSAAMLAGGVIAAYQLGYGLAAVGVGPLLDHGVSLATIYGIAAAVAVGLGAVSLGVTRALRTEGATTDAAAMERPG